MEGEDERYLLSHAVDCVVRRGNVHVEVPGTPEPIDDGGEVLLVEHLPAEQRDLIERVAGLRAAVDARNVASSVNGRQVPQHGGCTQRSAREEHGEAVTDWRYICCLDLSRHGDPSFRFESVLSDHSASHLAAARRRRVSRSVTLSISTRYGAQSGHTSSAERPRTEARGDVALTGGVLQFQWGGGADGTRARRRESGARAKGANGSPNNPANAKEGCDPSMQERPRM